MYEPITVSADVYFEAMEGSNAPDETRLSDDGREHFIIEYKNGDIYCFWHLYALQ